MLTGPAGVLAQAPAAPATDFPNRPIRFIVPFPAGTGSDLSARHFAKKLNEYTGQPVIVDNRGGGNGFPAAVAVKTAPADGYTILFGSSSTLATNMVLLKAVPYDPLVDFAPVSTVMKSPVILAVPANSPYKTIGEFIEAAKKAPGKMNVGTGSAAYLLLAELFSERAGVKVTNVPYKGVAEVLQAILSSQLDMGLVEPSAAMELVKAGKVRPLLVGVDHRLPAMPDVPTSAEAGLPGFSGFTWIGVVAPAATPRPVLDKLSALFMRALASPDTKQFYAAQNVEIMTGGQDEMRPFWRDQIEQWRRVAVNAKVEPQ
jgi:tripartite-type tricarboxylate transporter receptor subunit TctC